MVAQVQVDIRTRARVDLSAPPGNGEGRPGCYRRCYIRCEKKVPHVGGSIAIAESQRLDSCQRLCTTGQAGPRPTNS
jgi:hypothetical protein